jgi:hypothetical protein
MAAEDHVYFIQPFVAEAGRLRPIAPTTERTAEAASAHAKCISWRYAGLVVYLSSDDGDRTILERFGVLPPDFSAGTQTAGRL